MKIFISNNNDWLKLLNTLSRKKIVAFDLEANGLHAYPEHVCLLQFADENNQYIVYPEVIENHDSLRAFFKNGKIEKIFHSCDYDIRSLHRDFNVSVKNLFDTAVAAQFLGAKQLGLANVLNKFLNLNIEKNKKFQKMDWGKRPLPENALDYAADDVAHLIKLRNILVNNLVSLNRLDWAKEEINRLVSVRFKNNNALDQAFLKIKGVRALKPRQLAILKELCIFREKLALKKNAPPYKIISNKTLVILAKNPETNLKNLKGVGKWLLNSYKNDLLAAIRYGLINEPVSLPALPKKPPWNNGANARLAFLKKWRTKKGEELALDPAILWPVTSLQKIARDPSVFDLELDDTASDVRNWQKNNFADEVAAIINKF